MFGASGLVYLIIGIQGQWAQGKGQNSINSVSIKYVKEERDRISSNTL